MSTLTRDLANILEDNGFGTVGVDIFVSEDVPPKPDEMVIIKDSGTLESDFPSIDLSSPMFQIVTRSGKGGYQDCERKAFKIKDFLKYVAGYVVNDSRFIYINHLSGPVDIGIDEIMRPSCSTNYRAFRTDNKGKLRVKAIQATDVKANLVTPIELFIVASQTTAARLNLEDMFSIRLDVTQETSAVTSMEDKISLRLVVNQLTFSWVNLFNPKPLYVDAKQLTSSVGDLSLFNEVRLYADIEQLTNVTANLEYRYSFILTLDPWVPKISPILVDDDPEVTVWRTSDFDIKL